MSVSHSISMCIKFRKRNQPPCPPSVLPPAPREAQHLGVVCAGIRAITPIAGWLMMENPTEMDDDCG